MQTSSESSRVYRAVSAGDIVRTSWPHSPSTRPNLYLGSGRSGACFDAFGLMNADEAKPDRRGIGRTVLTHADHWHRVSETGMDYCLPVGQLRWAGELPDRPREYRQDLQLYDGLLTTTLGWPDCRLDLQAYFNPELRDVLAVEITYDAADGDVPAVELVPDLDPSVPMHGRFDIDTSVADVDVDSDDSFWAGTVRAGTAESRLGLSVSSEVGSAGLKSDGEQGVTISFGGERGKHLLLVGAAASERREKLERTLRTDRVPAQYNASARRAWHDRWGDSWVELPVPEYQALWARSLYYVLSSYAPEVRAPAPPHGWSGHGWGFHFPQDLSYVHPALLRHGHFDIAKAVVEFYQQHLDQTREWTRRVFDAAGTMWEWEYPIGSPHDRPHPNDGYPHEKFHFEIHNAAYPARMAAETAEYLDDPEWTRDVAWPVVRGSARFYRSVLEQGDEGSWGIELTPSMGQDELGGMNARNYLCALFSARYTLETAVEMGSARSLDEAVDSEELDGWRTVLNDGLAFERLRCDAGFYLPNEDTDQEEVLGDQKHPVQLNPLTFLPLEIDDATREAYSRRDELCEGMDSAHSRGWTLPAYAVAASHIGDPDGLFRELGRLVPGELADQDLVQLFETSGARERPYYVTSHGLLLQSLVDSVLSDYGDDVAVGRAWPDAYEPVEFGGLHVADGVRSGRFEDGEWHTDEADR